jgi:cation transport regulator ChaC
MPAEHQIDPTWLDVAATQLARSSAAALDASHELLAHYSDVGERSTQRGVDTLVNEAVGALGTLTERLAETSQALQEAGLRAITSPAKASRATTSRAITTLANATRATSTGAANRAAATRHADADGCSTRSAIRRQGT